MSASVITRPTESFWILERSVQPHDGGVGTDPAPKSTMCRVASHTTHHSSFRSGRGQFYRIHALELLGSRRGLLLVSCHFSIQL